MRLSANRKSWCFARIELYVGRWLAAAAERINENRIAFGCHQINDYMKIKPSSDEEGGTPQA